MDGRETVLLIHGTGAGEEGAVGSEKWWQPSGLFARSLGAALRREQAGKTIELVAFKWSGANSEYARRQGGIEPSHRLDEYEQQGTDYHLIGHSHGGSVIGTRSFTPPSRGSDATTCIPGSPSERRSCTSFPDRAPSWWSCAHSCCAQSR